MKRPSTRTRLPRRRDAMRYRYLAEEVSQEGLSESFHRLSYKGSPKHKRLPHLHGLEPFNGIRGDATLCDRDAGWKPTDDARIARLLERSRNAILVGNLLWTVDDNGWIYELQRTNPEQNEHHGYPLLPTDPFAQKVYRRFADWATQSGQQADHKAMRACQNLYGVKI